MESHKTWYSELHLHAYTYVQKSFSLTEIWSSNDLHRALDEWRPSANTINPRASSSGLNTVKIFKQCIKLEEQYSLSDKFNSVLIASR